MAIEVKKTSEIKVGDNFQLKCLGYGKTGKGKSRIIRTLPKPVFVFDTDQGELVNAGVEGITFVSIPFDAGESPSKSWPAYLEAKAYFLSHKNEFKSVVIDSITTLADSAMAQILQMNKHDTPTLPDYNQEKDKVKDELMQLIGSGKHVYIIAHEDIVRNEVSGQVWYLPGARGKLQQQLPIWFDEVWNFDSRKKGMEIEYFVRVKSDTLYVAKSRMAGVAKDKVGDEQGPDFQEYAKKCGVTLK